MTIDDVLIDVAEPGQGVPQRDEGTQGLVINRDDRSDNA